MTIWVKLFLLRKADDIIRDQPARSGNGDGFAIEAFGQSQRLCDSVMILFAQTSAGFDAERGPWRTQTVCEALGVANETGRTGILADTNEDPVSRRPRSSDRARLHLLEQLLVHPLGGAPQGELTQCREIGRREIVLERPLRLLWNIDLPFFEPLNEIVWRQINKLDRVGTVENGIRHRFAHTHAGNLSDDVVEALDVLDIDGRIDVDTRAQKLFDVLVPFGMAAAGSIRMRKLVDEDEAWVAASSAASISNSLKIGLA